MALNGTTQYLTLGTALAALNGKTGSTLMAWFNGPAAVATEGIVTLSIGTTVGSVNARARLQILATGPMEHQGRNTNDLGTLVTQDGTASVPINTWCHLAATLDLTGTDATTFYLNGVQDAQFTNAYANTSWPATNSETGSIGSQNANGALPLAGSLADVRIYDRPLSAAEIAGIYFSRGADANFYGLMHRWILNELSPGTAVSAPKDTAIQARHPTVVGAPSYAAHPIRTRRAYF